jgi:hypothetical protein
VSVGVLLAGCTGLGGGDGGGDAFGPPVEGVPGSSTATPAITAAPALSIPPEQVRTVATGLRIPWGMASSNRDQVGAEDRVPQTAEGDRILSFTPPTS